VLHLHLLLFAQQFLFSKYDGIVNKVSSYTLHFKGTYSIHNGTL